MEENMKEKDNVVEFKKPVEVEETDAETSVQVDIAETAQLKKIEDDQRELLRVLGSIKMESFKSETSVMMKIQEKTRDYETTLQTIKAKYKVKDLDMIKNIDYEKGIIVGVKNDEIAKMREMIEKDREENKKK